MSDRPSAVALLLCILLDGGVLGMQDQASRAYLAVSEHIAHGCHVPGAMCHVMARAR